MKRMTGAFMLAIGTFGLLLFEIAHVPPGKTWTTALAFVSCLAQLFGGAYLARRDSEQ